MRMAQSLPWGSQKAVEKTFEGNLPGKYFIVYKMIGNNKKHLPKRSLDTDTVNGLIFRVRTPLVRE